MMKVASTATPILKPGENSRVDVRRSLNGGAVLTIAPKAVRYIEFNRETAIGIALALLEAAGVPIAEAFARREAGKAQVTDIKVAGGMQ